MRKSFAGFLLVSVALLLFHRPLLAQKANPIGVHASHIGVRFASVTPHQSTLQQSGASLPEGLVGGLLGGILGGTLSYFVVTGNCDASGGCSTSNAVLVGTAIGVVVGIGVEWLVRRA